MDALLNGLIALATAALAVVVRRLWKRRREVAAAAMRVLDRSGRFAVVGTDRRTGMAWAGETSACGRAAARWKVEAMGIDVAKVDRLAA